MNKYEKRRLALVDLCKALNGPSGQGGQKKVSDAIGVAATSISRMVKGAAMPGGKNIGEDTVEKLNASFPGWLDGRGSSSSLLDEIDTSPVSLRMVPFLNSWVRAGEFTQSAGQYSLEDGEEMLPSPFFCGKRTYAVTVRGDSMADPTGYFPGDIVFIDPDAGYAPGDDVVAMDKEGRLSLKRYKEHETGQPYLLQLNGNKIIEIDGEWHVCGRVIFSARKR